ncbi:MAG: glycosyltransferase family 2 protein [Ruminococcus sp.]|nr:glycosyltransferase family 2 protein [Ruminococcus sp.]
MISIIIPSYNEEGNVSHTAEVVRKIMEKNNIPYELVFVNDGSSDGTWERLEAMARADERIVAVNFSRNFGKESAIFAGLETARGDACVLMDCDLQHPPETIVEMYKIWKNNDVDIVEGRKADRGKENKAYRGFSLLFYKLIKKASGLDMDAASDFKLLDRRAVDALLRMPERLTFFRAMSSWVGFKTEKVFFEVQEREVGESKWTTRSLIKFAINNITSFTSAPMQIVTVCGILTFIVSLIMGISTIVQKILGESDAGFPTVIVLQLLTSSIIMFSLGIIGFYISKIYEEIKNRPRYIIRDIVRKNDEGESK